MFGVGLVAAAVLGAGVTPNCAIAALATGLPAGTRLIEAEAIAPAAPGTVRARLGALPITSGLPAHCRVRGTINARKGANGKDYAIGFELALPADWNGRLLFQGGGGLNGVLNAALGDQATGDRPALARGFAVVSTDGGHRGARGFDFSFRVDQQAALDFAQASVGTTTIAAKQLVAAHYGRPAHHSYIVGCSTGGREAMLASQRYPDLFDGIVSGAPAMRTGFSNVATSYITVMLNRASIRDASGRPTALFSAADKALILRSLLEDCDALDGLKDGIVAKVGACRFRPARIACKEGAQANCLTAAQVRGLEAAFMPPRNAAGTILYPAFPWDTGIVESGKRIPGILTTGVASPLGPPNMAVEIDLDARENAVRADAMQMLTDTAGWTNLSTFLDRGGRIIWYHGVSDPWFSAFDTQDYFERAAKANGARWHDAARLFMVPGAGHCSGGADTHDSFDLLSAVVDWVESGTAPNRVPARRGDGKPGERPLCAWPRYPHYRGSGSPQDAKSFDCRS